ncbi:MAG TPA: dipeptidase PepE [Kofleriaceae bacterium]|nr:dipeptidase PepE [Kofleriaceae bacterium]
MTAHLVDRKLDDVVDKAVVDGAASVPVRIPASVMSDALGQCRLLLISNSNHRGMGFLAHCVADIEGFLGATRQLLFIPYALDDHDRYAEIVCERFAQLQITVRSLHSEPNPHRAVREASAFFVGGGNTFVLLKRLYDLGLLEAIRERVWSGVPYIGSSAGTNIATASIHTTNDMPVVMPPSLRALEIVPFNINPHYVDPDPDSRHAGETRDQRIREFHQYNDAPVVGLREGAALRLEGRELRLIGTGGARIFRRGEPPVEVSPGERLDALLLPVMAHAS